MSKGSNPSDVQTEVTFCVMKSKIDRSARESDQLIGKKRLILEDTLKVVGRATWR